ncbi:hypothetical protein FXO38_33230 [Capsicum annuum]|uniref:Uncharacterized protein n=1 Tax=Capsicum annuum TaxID=4072 RepID=A0A2G2Z8N8_CAPAN|nr:hypothetical protein FXO38_33230 [Capsicum annuum]KAF3659958.1 hypothetical protein FXO37_13736 [Capsicum annuum]PHT78366.1 hypothetical protein T459_16418 [Capsicum annuum]
MHKKVLSATINDLTSPIWDNMESRNALEAHRIQTPDKESRIGFPKNVLEPPEDRSNWHNQPETHSARAQGKDITRPIPDSDLEEWKGILDNHPSVVSDYKRDDLHKDELPDQEKILLEEYTSVLRNFKGVKMKLNDVEIERRERYFQYVVKMNVLKNASALTDA